MTSRAKVLAPLGTFVVVVAVGVTATLVWSPSGGHGPRLLHLAAGRSASSAPSLAVAGGGYTLVGTLPSGTPADAPAWTLTSGSAGSDLIARLATAFRAGRPTRTGTGWRAGGLIVSGEAGQSWWYSQCGMDRGVTSTGAGALGVPAPAVSSAVGCAVAAPGASSGGVAPPPAIDPPATPASVVTSAAAPVLEALSLSGGTVTTSGYGGSVTVTRRVGALEAVGLATRVDIDREGVVQSASGWLGGIAKADSYPLVSAREALGTLRELPRLDVCRIGPDGKGCVPPAPLTVTGAHLGLSLQALTGNGQVLVPSWLFDVKGSSEPLVAVAVQTRFLGGDEPTADPGTGSSPGAGPGSRVLFGFDTAKAGATPRVLVLGYSDSSSCPHAHVTPLVKESSDTVYVQLESDARPLGIACTANALAKTVDVTLQSALAGRTVVDLTDDKTVPLS